MQLIAQRGLRSVFSYAEVAEALGMGKRQVEWLVASGKLKKRGTGEYPFFQKDVNEFLTRLNAGEISIGRGRKAAGK